MREFVYILAASHSGSTLLTMLLNAHPAIASVGELSPAHIGDLASYRCSCGRRIRLCPFWEHTAWAARASGVDFRLEAFPTRFAMPESRLATRLLRPLHRGPALEWVRDTSLRCLTAWPRHFAQVARANEVLVRAILDYYGTHVFVDKGRALRLKYLLRLACLNVKVIHLVRDGRAVALTHTDPAGYADATDPRLRGGGDGGKRPDPRLSMSQAAWQWGRCMEEARHALHRLAPSRWIRIRYEDLCTETARTISRVFRFLGVDPHQEVRDFRSVEHHVIANGMRLDATSDIRLDERWRSVLSDSDLRLFDDIGGKPNKRLGYA